LYPEAKFKALSKICELVLNIKICKGETISNWERRPLRQSQMHYAAVDACVLMLLYEKFEKKSIEQNKSIESYAKTYLQTNAIA
jgi:ribonuclease D